MNELPTECVKESGEEKGSETSSMRFVSNGEAKLKNKLSQCRPLLNETIGFQFSLFEDHIDLVYGLVLKNRP